MSFLGRTWPFWIALFLLAAGVHAWIDKYPRSPAASSLRGQALAGDTTIVAAVLSDVGSSWDTVSVSDPFHRGAARISAPSGGGKRSGAHSPSRRWKLKGTAGNAVATLIDSLGIKHIIRVGDSEGGAKLLEVHSNRVLMQDAAGKFELVPEP